MKALADVFICKGAEPFLEDALQQLKFSQNDRSQDVRGTFYEVLKVWLTNMEIGYIRAYEHHLVLFMINGISDESKDISKACAAMLELHGTNMKQALIELGEEKPAEKKEENSSMIID
jgi:hypothetical protein